MPASRIGAYIAISLVTSGLTPVRVQASLVIAAAGVAVNQNFNTLTSGTSLPNLNAGGWRTWTTFEQPTFAGGVVSPTLTLQTATLDFASASTTYSFRDGAATSDKSLGFIFASSVARSIMVELKNDTGSVLSTLSTAWNLERYRTGQSPLNVSFFHSTDGVTWLSGATDDVSYAADTEYLGSPSPSSIAKNVSLTGLNLPNGGLYYLRWNFARPSGSDQTSAVGLDNFSITGTAAVPEVSTFFATGVSGCMAWLWQRARRRSQR